MKKHLLNLFVKSHNLFLCALLTLFLGSTFAQSVSALPITGRVISKSTGEPIPGVNIIVKGTNKGVVTDLSGKFKLEANTGDVIVFSFIGYKAQSVTIGQNHELSIGLEEAVEVLSEIAIVGSRSTKPRTDVERPAPVDVLNAKELQATGQVDLGQMVQFTSPSFNSAKTGINGVANYADPATLRGLSPDQVLVLVNGKRRHQFSALNLNVTLGKGTVVTDMNTIPSLATERIEILRDGAAAQYGSDAIAGIVNVALKKSVNEGMFKTQYGVNKMGDGASFLAAVNYGIKLGKDKSFLNFTIHHQNVEGTDRSDPYNGTIYSSNATTDAAIRATRGFWPATTPFKVSKYGSNQTKSTQVFINAGYPLNDQWSLYAFGGFSQKDILAYGFFRNAIPTNANSTPEIFPDGYAPTLPGKTQDYSGVVGLSRKVKNGWNMDFSTGYGYNSLDMWANGTTNPSMGAASPTNFYVARSTFGQNVSELNFSKSIEGLGVKSMNLALGAQYRVDNFTLVAGDEFSYKVGDLAKTKGKAPGSSGRPGIAPDDATDISRSNIGIYADVESDITDKLLIATALRYENYSDFGGNISGKLAARQKLTNNISIRGSINKGFRAPSLQQIYNSVTTSTVQAGEIRQTKQLRSNDPRLKQLGIEDPKAETSWNYNVGITAQAGDKFLFTLDAYQIDITDRIIISEALPVASIASIKALFPGIQEISFFTNAINTTTKGIDFVTTYKQNKSGKGFNASLALTFNKTEISSVKATPTALQAGTAKAVVLIDTISRSLIETSQPRNKVLMSLGYQMNKVGVNVRATYFGEIVAWEKPTGGYHRSQTFTGKTLFDASVTYQPTKALMFTLGGNNITDVYPDKVYTNYASYFNGQTPYTRNGNQFGFNGAFYYLNASLNF
jgi:iron complex outermembrane recepter protein